MWNFEISLKICQPADVTKPAGDDALHQEKGKALAKHSTAGNYPTRPHKSDSPGWEGIKHTKDKTN